jgi:hypothetical protein
VAKGEDLHLDWSLMYRAGASSSLLLTAPIWNCVFEVCIDLIRVCLEINGLAQGRQERQEEGEGLPYIVNHCKTTRCWVY